jgi:hypothetical protein
MWDVDWIPRDLGFAAGSGKQRLYIIPSLKMVIVRQARVILESLAGQRSGFSDIEFLSRLLRGQDSIGHNLNQDRGK